METAVLSREVVYTLLGGFAFLGWLIYWVHPRLTSVSISRAGGFHLVMNDISEYSKTIDGIKDIDSSTCESIRQGTTGLAILPPKKYGLTPEVMIVNVEAIAPLVYAAYENRHTRKLIGDKEEDNDHPVSKCNVYITNKANEIAAATRMWRKQFPDLTDSHCEAFANLWVYKVLIPNLMNACSEKVSFYKERLRQTDLSEELRKIISDCLAKNERYVKCIDELSQLSDIQEKSNIFNQEGERPC
jgi:hypothetical protein